MSWPIVSWARYPNVACRMVPPDHAPPVIHRHDCVERSLEHRPEARLAASNLFFGVAPRDELTDLAAEHTHHLQEPFIRLPQLVREELHHAHDPARLWSGKPNAACSPLLRAASARGKFASEGASTTQRGSPDTCTWPGSLRRKRA